MTGLKFWVSELSAFCAENPLKSAMEINCRIMFQRLRTVNHEKSLGVWFLDSPCGSFDVPLSIEIGLDSPRPVVLDS
jgi:hypothetical protein